MLTYSIWAGNYAFVIPKQHREIFAAAGWTKQDIREYVVRGRARETRRVALSGQGGGRGAQGRGKRLHARLRSPDDLLVVAAGGPAGGFGAILPPWYGKNRWRSPSRSAA